MNNLTSGSLQWTNIEMYYKKDGDNYIYIKGEINLIYNWDGEDNSLDDLYDSSQKEDDSYGKLFFSILHIGFCFISFKNVLIEYFSISYRCYRCLLINKKNCI